MSYSSNSRAIESFKLLSESFAQAGPIYLPLLLLAVPATLLSIGQYLTTKPQSIDGQMVLMPTGATLVFLGLNAIVSLILFGGIFLLAYRYVKQGTTDVSGSLRRGAVSTFDLLLGSIIYFVAVFIGLILLIVPGMYLGISLGFFPYIIVAEKCSLIDSFKHSMALVKGRWWPTFGSWLVLALVFIPVGIMASLGGAIFGIFAGSSGSRLTAIETYTNVVSAVLSLFLLPIANIYTAKLYNRLAETMD